MEGPLSKWTNLMKGWQYRWFVLDDNAGLLSYYTSKDKMIRGARRGCVRLQDAIIGIDDEEDSTFTITVDHKVFHFQARDSEERKQWVCALEETILRHNQKKMLQGPSIPSLDDFDRKLAEADAYLELLIENVKCIDNKINALDSNVHGKQDLEGVLQTAQEMIEAVKKSIVLLQLAKVAVTSSRSDLVSNATSSAIRGDHNSAGNMIESDMSTTIHTSDASRSAIDDPGEPDSDRLESESAFVIVNKPSEDGDQTCLEGAFQADKSATQRDEVADANGQSPDLAPPLAQDASSVLGTDAIPTVSYSSSEDESEFFDADEGLSSSSNREKGNPSASRLETKERDLPDVAADERSPSPVVENQITNLPEKNEPEPGIDLNIFTQEESHMEKEGESLEEHKSVIMHLLSQVKLGMDLTKVVLPTFILEKRSLLEMYADFFSHADYFLAIAQKPTPEERMIACVRFYLSTFGAGRNSSVAKKPYNPIIGETFRCFWNHPSFPTKTNPPVQIEKGPVPWAKSNQLTFLAEQVSHHPPVSAFYAEHVDQGIQFNGHIWTKSKFLGLSVGVHNIGQGCVRLLEHDEEYILNFPNGYGRSILTVPWFELGGDCTITCEKTGLNAFIKFHTKPFYGGKIHKVTGEILQPNVKKPLCTFEGEWNTLIYCNYSTGKSERFIDTKRATIKKIVKRIELQEPMESRRLWETVTKNLGANKIDEATEAKRLLEDKQRSDAKERLEKNIVYKPNYFYEDSCQNWIYKSMLEKRA